MPKGTINAVALIRKENKDKAYLHTNCNITDAKRKKQK